MSVPSSFEVLYENEELVVINKPANVPMDRSTSLTGDAARSATENKKDAASRAESASGGEQEDQDALAIRSVEDWAMAYMKRRGLYDAEHAALEREQKRKKQLKFIHQLDAATSGVLCLAFSKAMASRLAHCFEAGTAEKAYIALVAGHVAGARLAESTSAPVCAERLRAFVKGLPVLSHMGAASSTVPDAPSARNPTMSTKSSNDLSSSLSVVDESPDGSHATIRVCLPVGYDPLDPVHFRMAVGPRLHEQAPDSHQEIPPPADQSTVEWRRRDRFRPAETLVDIQAYGFLKHEPSQTWWPVTQMRLAPRTGRRHQLRVHCHALGHPIVGDPLYAKQPLFMEARESNTSRDTSSRFPTDGWPRMYLHAQRLRLPCSVRPLASEAERVALKKRRRRETLGLESTVSLSEADEITVFETTAPFFLSPSPGGPAAPEVSSDVNGNE